MYFNKLNYNLQLYIASKLTGKSKEYLMTDSFEITDEMNEIARDYLVNERPLSKIFNEKYFWKYCFYTNDDTLDPRPETEQLIELVLSHNHQRPSLLELGVGTGAIILTLMKEMNIRRAVGIDISAQALSVCEKNANLLNVKPELRLENWLDNINEKFDILVSNPPYLLKEEIEEHMNVLKYDPFVALYGGIDGMYFYEKIAEKQHLFNYIYLEVPDIRKNEVAFLFKSHPRMYMI
jgi:release factor glutamine methyltransferase